MPVKLDWQLYNGIYLEIQPACPSYQDSKIIRFSSLNCVSIPTFAARPPALTRLHYQE